MSNKEYIKDKFKKHPLIMKSLLKMKSIEAENHDYLVHFKEIIDSGIIKREKLKLNYLDYNSFLELYEGLLNFLNIEKYNPNKESKLPHFLKRSFEEKLRSLNDTGIKHKIKD